MNTSEQYANDSDPSADTSERSADTSERSADDSSTPADTSEQSADDSGTPADTSKPVGRLTQPPSSAAFFKSTFAEDGEGSISSELVALWNKEHPDDQLPVD